MKNINMNNWSCRHCGRAEIDNAFYNALRTLDEALGEIGWKLLVNSGFRCVIHNAAVGGHVNSRHLHGQAVDLSVVSPRFVTPQQLADFIDEKLGGVEGKYSGGLGVYKTFVHVDCGRPSRWGE